MTAVTHNLPTISREPPPPPMSVATPMIPLNFVYPGLSLAQIVAIVRGHWKLSLLILVVVLSLTVLVIALWPRTYMSTVTMMVSYEVNDPLNGKELPVGQVASYITTQLALMQTPEVLLTVVDRLKLTENKKYAQGYPGGNATLREWVALNLSKNLAVSQGLLGSQLIYATYSAQSPTEAAQVANTVAEVYKEQDERRSSGPPTERAQRLAQQLSELKSKVDQAQLQVTEFYQRNGLVDGGNKANLDVVLLETLEGRLPETQNLRRAAEARASGDRSNNDQVLASTQIQALKTQLITQESRLAQLNTTHLPQYPDIVELLPQIEITRRSLAAALQNYSDNATAGLSMARWQEQNLLEAITEQRAKVLTNGQLHGAAAKYLLELESAQAIYKRALESYDQTIFAASRHYSNVSFVSRAMPPVKASKPKGLTMLILGVAAAGLLGLGIPMLYELFNRRVRCRDDIERNHGIPVLVEFGALPMGMRI